MKSPTFLCCVCSQSTFLSNLGYKHIKPDGRKASLVCKSCRDEIVWQFLQEDKDNLMNLVKSKSQEV